MSDPSSYGAEYGYAAEYGYGAEYGSASYGGGAYGYDGYAADAFSGYTTSWTNPDTGLFYQHSVYGYASGLRLQITDEIRSATLDSITQSSTSIAGGVYTTDYLETQTPLDGVYQSYGDRQTSSYDTGDHTSTFVDVVFGPGYSHTDFYSVDYDSGTTVTAYDVRNFYAYGFYDYTQSAYAGPEGYSARSYGTYYANA